MTLRGTSRENSVWPSGVRACLLKGYITTGASKHLSFDSTRCCMAFQLDLA